jgi:hypothetical protein
MRTNLFLVAIALVFSVVTTGSCYAQQTVLAVTGASRLAAIDETF